MVGSVSVHWCSEEHGLEREKGRHSGKGGYTPGQGRTHDFAQGGGSKPTIQHAGIWLGQYPSICLVWKM